MAPAIAAALAGAELTAKDVIAIGVSGQLDGCVPVDANGEPTAPCLIWMDRRAEGVLPELPDDFRERTGLTADASHMAAKIRWLQQQGTTAARFHQPVSYLVSRMTGEHVFDHGHASTTMVYNLATRGFDDDLLSRFGIDSASLPRIADAHSVAGELTDIGARLTGLLPGVPVAVGTGDDFATPLGAGLTEPGTVACVLGTAEVVGALSPSIVIDDAGLVETHAYATDAYFVENPGWLSGGALSWLSETVGFSDARELDQAAAEVPPGADDLLFLPALSGAMAPEWIASARGCFYGLTPAHGRGHLARAVLEGCSFAMRDVVDRLGELNVRRERMLLLGGGANSSLWAQIRADVCRLPIDIARRVDTCPIGAAILAAVAAGIHSGVGDCARLVSGPVPRATPGANSDLYSRPYDRYRRLFDALRPMMISDG